ncbi:MAG: hypothetical protein ACOC9J_03730, partial [Persicimonas sp.]
GCLVCLRRPKGADIPIVPSPREPIIDDAGLDENALQGVGCTVRERKQQSPHGKQAARGRRHRTSGNRSVCHGRSGVYASVA